MKHFFATLVAVIVLVLAGLLQGLSSERWQPSAALATAERTAS